MSLPRLCDVSFERVGIPYSQHMGHLFRAREGDENSFQM